MGDSLALSQVRSVFRLIGDLRALGSDPAQWRTRLVRKMRCLLDADIVISSEVHVRPLPGHASDGSGKMCIVDRGWGCDGDGAQQIWQIDAEHHARPEEFILSLLPNHAEAAEAHGTAPVRPAIAFRAGRSFVLSQYLLPHLGAVDQLGVHKDSLQKPFTDVEHRLIRLFHKELGRLWRKDTLVKARDPQIELPPRLAQTLSALQSGCSEKQVSLRLGISQHTVHNYVQALHARLGVSSRGELLARMRGSGEAFLPQFSSER